MLNDELAEIKKKINQIEDVVEEEFDEVKEAILGSLYAMKKSVEKKIQRAQLEQEIKRRFESHIDTHSPSFQRKGNEFGGDLLRCLTTNQKKIANVYEAASSKKVEENFNKSIQKQMFLLDDFLIVVSTCRTRGLL